MSEILLQGLIHAPRVGTVTPDIEFDDGKLSLSPKLHDTVIGCANHELMLMFDPTLKGVLMNYKKTLATVAVATATVASVFL